MSYLHGVEIKETARQAVLTEGESSVIALVGTAPIGSVNVPKLITSLAAGVTEFGEDIGGFTIPAALGFIFSHVSAKILVINVLANADAAALVVDGKMTKDVDGKWLTNIGEAVIPAAVDYSDELIAGLEMLNTLEDSLGIKPNLIIVPGYSQLSAIMAKMDEVAKKLNGFALVDMVAATVAAALEARANGTFATASPAVILAFPRIMRYNAHENENQPLGLSVAIALAKAATDTLIGYWISPSNYEIGSILGTEVAIRSSLTDAAADTNLLNAQGIVTVFRRTGTGARVWGNWTAAFPTVATADAMIAPRAVRMMIRETLIDAALLYLDRNNITKITVEMIQNAVNAFLRNLIGRGAINDGSCTWDADKNPASEITQGKLLYTISVTYGPSLDKLTFEEVVDANYNL
jgi:phage tail sheath protein FI